MVYNPTGMDGLGDRGYYLPFVTPDTVEEFRAKLVRQYKADIDRYVPDQLVQLELRNPRLVGATAMALQAGGYAEEGAKRAGHFSMITTHLLLDMQTRSDRKAGGQPVDDEGYYLPMVTQTAVQELFSVKKLRNYRYAMVTNPCIPGALNKFPFSVVGGGMGASRGCQAAELAYVVAHGLLREQARFDALSE